MLLQELKILEGGIHPPLTTPALNYYELKYIPVKYFVEFLK